jgi:hypothetical protein
MGYPGRGETHLPIDLEEGHQRGRRYLQTGERLRPGGATAEGVRALDVNGPGVLPAGAVRRA